MSEHKGVRSWIRRLWMWLRRGVGWKSPRPDVEPVKPPPEPVVEVPVPVPDDPLKRLLSSEEQAKQLASHNAQEMGHDIDDFVEQVSLDKNKKFKATCKKCGLDIVAVVEYNEFDVTGLPGVTGKAKNKRCTGGVGGYSSGTS